MANEIKINKYRMINIKNILKITILILNSIFKLKIYNYNLDILKLK